MTQITLTNAEVATAWDVAKAREERALCGLRYGTPYKDRRINRNGSSLGDELSGACGEFVVAKYLGIPWPDSVDIYAFGRHPDLPPDWQVRTRARADADLVIRPKDDPGQRFVLVTGAGPEFRIRGCIRGRAGMRIDYYADRGNYGRPAYWVPQRALVPMEGRFSVAK